jgi:hypothetical protein
VFCDHKVIWVYPQRGMGVSNANQTT